MNICYVIFSSGWAGAETVVYELASHLTNKGENVSIILNHEMLGYYADLKGVKLFDIGSIYNPLSLTKSIISSKAREEGTHSIPHNRVVRHFYYYSYSREFLSYVYYKRIRERVKQFLFDNQVEIVHSHLAEAAFFVFELGKLEIPTITSTHGQYYLSGDMPVHPLMRPLVKWKTRRFEKAVSRVDKVVEVSASTLNDYERRGIILKDKSAVIWNGVNVSEIQTGRQSSLKLKGGFNLLFPGGAKFVKGGDLLIEALAKVKQELPDIHLYIALDVPLNHPLREMVSNLGLEDNITFSGFLPKEDYRNLLNSVDLFILPSRKEAFPISCLEAMALGKSIVTTKSGSITEIFKDGRNGILTDPDSGQIAEAILYLYRNKGLRGEISRNNLEDITRFDWDHIVDQYLWSYKEISKLGQHNGNPLEF